MIKKIRERLDFWDLKSIVSTTLIISIVISLLYFLPNLRDRLRTEDKENFKGQVEGKILTIEKVDRISQSKWKGTEITVDSYKVKYQFQFQGQTYENIDIIPLTVENKNLLTRVVEQKNKICLVKFDTHDPNKSLLTADE